MDETPTKRWRAKVTTGKITYVTVLPRRLFGRPYVPAEIADLHPCNTASLNFNHIPTRRGIRVSRGHHISIAFHVYDKFALQVRNLTV